MTKVNNKKLIAESMTDSNFWNVHDELKGLSLEKLKEIQGKETLPYAVCVLNLTGDLNTGMIARTACLHGCREMFIFGRRKYDKRSTVGAQNYMKITRVDGFKDDTNVLCVDKFLEMMKEHKYYPIAVEQGGYPINLVNAGDWAEIVGFLQEAPYPCLVFGNENEGIPEDILNECTATLSIPQRGVLRSMNVSAAAAIALHVFSFEVMRMASVQKEIEELLENKD